MKFARHIERDGKSVQLSDKEYWGFDWETQKETYVQIINFPREGLNHHQFVDIIIELYNNYRVREGNNGHSIFKNKRQMEKTLEYLDTVREQILTESARIAK